MITQISKVIFWSALAVFFCFIFGYSSQASAADKPVTINEVYYNPSTSGDTGLEWVKIYNPNDTSLDLNGYDLYTGYYYSLKNFILEPKKSVVVHTNLAGIDTTSDLFTGTVSQGNMGDSYGTVALFKTQTHSSSTIVDFVQYGSGGHTWQSAAVAAGIWATGDFVPNVGVGRSIKLVNSDVDNNSSADWLDNVIISPIIEEEESIILFDDEEILTISIAEARQKEAGEYVRINGVVTILPGNLSEQYFYIEDATGGIQIYCYKKDFPDLALGDSVEVTGEIGDYYTDKRVKIDDRNNIIIIGKSEAPTAKQVTIDEIGDDLVGQIVTFEGEVSSTSGSTFYLEGSGEIKVNIRELTGIDKPRMAVGDIVRITGVVAKYKNTYQVLPFEQAGVTILTSGKLPVGGKKDTDLSKSMLILSLWKLSPRAKKKLKILLKTLPKV